MAGYSSTPLVKKLGIKEEMRLLILQPPGGIDNWQLLEADFTTQLCKPTERSDFVHLFAASQKEFHQLYSKIEKRLSGNVSVWVSWYKKSSGIATDVTEDWIRNFDLTNNLVDVKVCAVTEQWSGLKLVMPVAKR